LTLLIRGERSLVPDFPLRERGESKLDWVEREKGGEVWYQTSPPF